MKKVEVSVTTELVRWPVYLWSCPDCGEENRSLCAPDSDEEADDYMTCEKCEGEFLPTEEPEVFTPCLLPRKSN